MLSRKSGGRCTRQPGQIRKEAATTNSPRVVPASTEHASSLFDKLIGQLSLCKFGHDSTTVMATIDLLDLELRQMLEPGERLLWHGKSDADKTFSSLQALGTMLFGIFWTAFMVFGLASRASGATFMGVDPLWVTMAMSFMFVLGLVMTSAPFLHQWTAQNTLYAITDQRLLAVGRGRWMAAAYNLNEIRNVDFSDNGDGTTSVRLETHRIGGAGSPARPGYTYLRGIRDGDLLKQLLNGRR
jgi:hypothetical protein